MIAPIRRCPGRSANQTLYSKSKLGPNPTHDPSSNEAILSEFIGKSMLDDMARAAALVGNGENWMDPIWSYLIN
jgi:hypothetical protein